MQLHNIIVTAAPGALLAVHYHVFLFSTLEDQERETEETEEETMIERDTGAGRERGDHELQPLAVCCIHTLCVSTHRDMDQYRDREPSKREKEEEESQEDLDGQSVVSECVDA